MTSGASSDPGSTPQPQEQTTPRQGVKRRRSSPPFIPPPAPTSAPQDQPDSKPAVAPPAVSSEPPRRTLRDILTETASSRSSNTMQRSSPERSGSSVKFTRTGRVSKAAKGQRVHHCDECGKTYTRAEHLRRHQQNHKPGAYPCDVPGCSRSFYREDLLTRHKARHNDPLNPPSRRNSIGSQTPAPTVDDGSSGSGSGGQSVPSRASVEVYNQAQLSTPENAPPASSIVDHSNTTSRAPVRKGYIPVNELHVGMPIAVDDATAGYSEFWAPSPPYSSDYDSPTNDQSFGSGGPYYGQPQAGRERNFSMASFYGGCNPPNSSRSPASTGSSAYLTHWGQSDAWNGSSFHDCLDRSPGSESSYTEIGPYNSNVFGDQHLVPATCNGSSRMMTAEERDFMEQETLVLPTTHAGTDLDLSFDDAFVDDEERYLTAYWAWVHPLFPIIHRPSFDQHDASPLLKAAMVALGAHMIQTHGDLSSGRIIHERCAKVLTRRTTQHWHTWRVCDMQAIVLVEVFSVYRSRRPPLQFSHGFEAIYRYLSTDPQVLDQGSMHDKMSSTSPIDVACKQRLLLTCYILDQQHSTLFGRQTTNCLDIAGMNLPFPHSQQDWDEPYRRHLEPSWPEFVHQALSHKTGIAASLEEPYDAFRSSLMLACMNDPNTDPEMCGFDVDTDHDVSPILLAVEQFPRMKLAFHTFMLCEFTPVRELLAVSGESWIMAEKLTSPIDFVAMQDDAIKWAQGTSSTLATAEEQRVEHALHHAMEILSLHAQHPRTGLLFQEWSIYLAALVIWARAYTTTADRSNRLSIPRPAEPRMEERELEHQISTLLKAGPTAALGRKDATNVLIWTKGKIEKVDLPHNCGVTSGALDVLKKLIMRGNEPGWFGV